MAQDAGKASGRGRVLVVDDYFLIRCNHKLFFERLGFEVVEATDGKEALAKLKEDGPESFRLLLVDLIMPGMNGADFIATCHKEFGEALPPVMACSSVSEPPIVRRVASIGISGYVVKPVDYRVMLKKLGELLPDEISGKLAAAV